ncbi:hypothetical protein L210DRAFT_858920 [Boletus edulis BED1]|uniref:Myb-like domain-containing protein n=1 Tax=Boletus edulis BED1 TaxID=1328754 RepID=A0AAD4C7W2_BOLED|nr:hypothetical protein L210DRAFT_858920 [Boletus edulis BED1]
MSDSSVSSGRSLHSQGPIIDPLLAASGRTQTQSLKVRKKAASWNEEETTALLEFLITESPKSGDGNFKRVTWTAAASLMATRFVVVKGGPKDADACECRFQLVCLFFSI